MKLKELQDKIERRVKSKQTLDCIEKDYNALQNEIENYGDSVRVEYISFVSPVDKFSFSMSHMPDIPASEILKSIGESIDVMKQYVELIDDELKGIVEFEDEEGKEAAQ